jgi:signal transduction histidine kinase
VLQTKLVVNRERTIIGAYVLALAVFVGVAAILFVHFQRYGERTQWVQHTLQVMTVASAALSDLKDIETGERGYLLAGEEDFLEPYDRAIKVVRARLMTAEALTADNPSQQARFHQLRPLVEQKIAFARDTIDMFRRGQRSEAQAKVATREGKLLMDDIRQRIDEILNQELELLGTRAEEAKASAWRTTALLVFGNGLAFALLASGTLVLGREFNRRKRLEQEQAFRDERLALRTSADQAQRRLEAVIDELPVAIVVMDTKPGSVALQNARMRELTGSEPLVPRHLDGSPYELGTDPLGRAIREGRIVRGEELRLDRGDQPLASVIADAAPVRDHDGRVLGAVGVFHDVNEVRRTAAERREAEQFRDLFLGALGHELRNPLSVITAGSASLSRRAISTADLKLAHRMCSSARRMERMIAQLLEFVQVRLGGGLVIDRQRMDLGALTRNVLGQIDVSYPERTIELALEGELAGAWDRERLAAVISALVENALEHGRADATVNVTVRSRGNEIVLEVRNQGNPIPRELLPLIFDPFRRAEERKRMKSAGLGIDLYLAMEIVRAHHGTLTVSSSAEEGTVFRVTLPKTHG